MNSKTKTLFGIAAFVIFIGVAAFAYKSLSKETTPQNNITIEESVGEVQGETDSQAAEKIKAPDFTVLDNDGNQVKLSELFGKPLVLNFWASWCPPCKAEMPDFNTVYEDMGEDVTFVMVDMVDGQRETMEKGKKHITDKAFTFPVYYDTTQEAAYTYGVSSIPSSYFIDKDGYIVTGVQGAIDEKTLRKGIEMIQENQSTSSAEYHKITAAEAKKQLDENKDVILVDVRTESEYNEKHIEGALLIPDNEIAERAAAELPDKDASILIYCRSGSRSETAAKKLVELGYTNVYDFGGINDYPYDTVP